MLTSDSRCLGSRLPGTVFWIIRKQTSYGEDRPVTDLRLAMHSGAFLGAAGPTASPTPLPPNRRSLCPMRQPRRRYRRTKTQHDWDTRPGERPPPCEAMNHRGEPHLARRSRSGRCQSTKRYSFLKRRSCSTLQPRQRRFRASEFALVSRYPQDRIPPERGAARPVKTRLPQCPVRLRAARGVRSARTANSVAQDNPVRPDDSSSNVVRVRHGSGPSGNATKRARARC